MQISYAGRVAIVTGAGRGLGRRYALDLAARGAKVVVNDHGGGVDGDFAGKPQVAHIVVEEILKAGGEAVASSADIASPGGADSLVETALSAFGTVHVLVNNAGILRDRPFSEMSAADFMAVQNVHVLGSFNCAKAVWPVMVDNDYGRIVLTASIAGMYGRAGQVNYGAAKGALIAMTHVLSHEGTAHGILVNAVAPMAVTRMAADFVLPSEVAERMTPDWASAAVLYLCCEEAGLTNQLIGAGMGYYAKAEMVEAQGFLAGDQQPSPELVRENFAQIADMANARPHASVEAFMGQLFPRVLSR